MRRSLLLLLSALLFSFSVCAQQTPLMTDFEENGIPYQEDFTPSYDCSCSQDYGFTDAEFRIGCFFPASRQFRDIYQDPLLTYGLEFTQNIWGNISVWENITWLPTNGHSTSINLATYLNLLTLSAGLKYCFCYDDYNTFHLGLGGVYYNLWTHDKVSSPFIDQHRHFQNGGVVVKGDYEHLLCNGLYWGLFLDYYYLPIKRAEGLIHDVGGLNVGARIGYHF